MAETKTIWDFIKQLNQKDWDYYDSGRVMPTPFIDSQSHTEFIKTFFKHSGKEEVMGIQEFLPNNNFDEARNRHTNSIFLFGILLRKFCFNDLEIWSEVNKPGYPRFTFQWFLCCLFHDAVFKLETDRNFFKKCKGQLKGVIEVLDIDVLLFEGTIEGVNDVLFASVPNYFKMKAKAEKVSQKVIDHGIIAGIYLYDRLLKIREFKESQSADGLYWGPELIPQYQNICSAIMVHNIWIPSTDNHAIYKKYELNGLINDYQPISISEWPLLYILGIVDTIDPIKALKARGFSAENIFKNLNLTLGNRFLRLEKKHNSKLKFSEITSRACGLPKWLNTEVNFGSDFLEIKMF